MNSRCSSGKVVHDTKKDATSALNYVLKEHRPDKPLRIYKCDMCNGYHLTSGTGTHKPKPILLHHAKEFAVLIRKRKKHGK